MTDKISIYSVGNFTFKKKSARKIHNPQTGEVIDVPACLEITWDTKPIFGFYDIQRE